MVTLLQGTVFPRDPACPPDVPEPSDTAQMNHETGLSITKL